MELMTASSALRCASCCLSEEDPDVFFFTPVPFDVFFLTVLSTGDVFFAIPAAPQSSENPYKNFYLRILNVLNRMRSKTIILQFPRRLVRPPSQAGLCAVRAVTADRDRCRVDVPSRS